MGAHVHQGVIDPLHPPAQGAGELPARHPGGCLGLRINEIGHRLGLHQVQLSVQEGPAGELSRAGLPGPLGEQGLQRQRQHHRGTVALELGRILAGIALRTT